MSVPEPIDLLELLDAETVLPEPTWHTLIPALDQIEQTIRDGCAEFGHLPLTYNASLVRTFCRCGAARYPGQHRPLHLVECYESGCSRDCTRARAEQLLMLAPEAGAEAAPKRFRRLRDGEPA